MERTIAVIQAALITTIQGEPILAASFTSTSMTAFWYLLTYAIAVCQWTLEVNQDNLQNEINAALAAQLVHKPSWYVNMAMAFQFGDALVPDQDYYDPIAPAGDPSLVINAAAWEKVGDVGRIKVATATAGVLGACSGPVMTSLTAYMQQVKDAGVDLEMTTGAADSLRVAQIIYYDPLILNATGQRLDGSDNTPVLNAINAYLVVFNNSFINGQNGVFIYNDYVTMLRAIPGVIDVNVTTAQANYGATPYVSIIPQYVPDAGYLALDAGYFAANIVYEPCTV